MSSVLESPSQAPSPYLGQITQQLANLTECAPYERVEVLLPLKIRVR
jgi:hypothetical protein